MNQIGSATEKLQGFNSRGQILNLFNLCKAEQHYCREKEAHTFTRQKFSQGTANITYRAYISGFRNEH